MNTKQEVTRLLCEVIDELNIDLPDNMKLKKSSDVELFGESGQMDSLLLVNLIVSMEQKIKQDLGVTIILGNERTMSQEPSPFITVDSLVNFILLLISEQHRT